MTRRITLEMDMPKRCYGCEFLHLDENFDVYCILNRKELDCIEVNDTIDGDCPFLKEGSIIKIPTNNL